MATHVISHQKPHRKRGQRSIMRRRFGALAVTIAALVAATWLAPYIARRAPAPLPSKVADPGAMPAPRQGGITEDTLLITADRSVAPMPRPRRARRGVPLDANAGDAREDFEVLSARELDAISQARD